MLVSTIFLSSSKIIQKIGIVALVIFVFLSLRFNYYLLTNPQNANLPRSERSGYLEEWTAGYGIKEAADYIISESLKDQNKTIVVGTEGYFGTLPDGAQIYLNNYPNIRVIGVGLGIEKIHQSLLDSKKFGNKTYLLVNSSRLKDNFDYTKVKLINSYKKAIKPDGSQEIFYVYEII